MLCATIPPLRVTASPPLRVHNLSQQQRCSNSGPVFCSMVDVLLIQPPIRDFYLTTKRTIPYGLACIASALIQDGFSVAILDALATHRSQPLEFPEQMATLKDYYGKSDISPFALFHQFKHFGIPFEAVGEAAKRSGAFLVGISSLFTAYSAEAITTAEVVKRYHPGCRVVLGGHHPTAMPESVMESSAIDYVIRGEGEVAMPALARALRSAADVGSVPGIVRRRPDGTIQVSEPAVLQVLDDHPGPALHLLEHAFYRRKETGDSRCRGQPRLPDVMQLLFRWRVLSPHLPAQKCGIRPAGDGGGGSWICCRVG